MSISREDLVRAIRLLQQRLESGEATVDERLLAAELAGWQEGWEARGRRMEQPAQPESPAAPAQPAPTNRPVVVSSPARMEPADGYGRAPDGSAVTDVVHVPRTVERGPYSHRDRDVTYADLLMSRAPAWVRFKFDAVGSASWFTNKVAKGRQDPWNRDDGRFTATRTGSAVYARWVPRG